MTRLTIRAALMLAGMSVWSAPLMAQGSPEKTAAEVLAKAPVVDGHNDIAEQVRDLYGNDWSKVNLNGLPPEMLAKVHTDIPTLRAGKLGGQFWSVYVDASLPPLEGMKQVLEQIDGIDQMAARYPETFKLVTNARDFEAAMKAGKVASMKGMEGGGAIANSPAVLRQFYNLGVRYMTLTHNKTVDWADACCDAPKSDGLSPLGVQMVKEMNRIGMIVDLSHTSEATMNDALDVTRAPVMFSHSNAYALDKHPRNVPDTVLRRVHDNGGIVMVTFVPGFLSQKVRDFDIKQEGAEAEIKMRFTGNPDGAKAAIEEWKAANPRPTASITDVADMIDHIKNVAGIDHVGIGGDFGGVSILPDGLQNISTYPALFTELARRGYSKADLAKISQGNVLRVMKANEAVSQRIVSGG